MRKILIILGTLVPIAVLVVLALRHSPRPTVPSPKVAATQAYPAEFHVEEFGIQEGQPVDRGFVFIDGKYLDAPYVVSRIGLAVCINGHVIENPMRWPPRATESGDVDPPLPPEIDRKTSIFDPVLNDYLGKKSMYIVKHYPREERPREMEKVLRALPLVKEASIPPDSPHVLEARTWSGQVENWGLNLREPMPTPTKAGVLKDLGELRAMYERGLAEVGGCKWFHRGASQYGFNDEVAMRILPKAVPVLRSSAPLEEKLALLQEAGLHLRGVNPIIVTGFSASDQLEKRLAKLLQGGSPPTTQSGG